MRRNDRKPKQAARSTIQHKLGMFRSQCLNLMVIPTRFERVTPRLGIWCSFNSGKIVTVTYRSLLILVRVSCRAKCTGRKRAARYACMEFLFGRLICPCHGHQDHRSAAKRSLAYKAVAVGPLEAAP